MAKYAESETVRESQAADAAREERGLREHQAAEDQARATTAETVARADRVAADKLANPGDKSPR